MNDETLTEKEVQFVIRVCKEPGLEPHDLYANLKDGEVPPWEKPYRLGLIKTAGMRHWAPTDKVSLSLKIKGEPSQELVERESLLERIDAVMKDNRKLEWKHRYSAKRVRVLRSLQRHLATYRDSLLDQQVTLRQMEKALAQELESAVGRC